MKQYIAGVACVATAVLTAPALTSTAYAAQPGDPVTALKSRIRSGHGVKFADITKMSDSSGNKKVFAQRKGVFRFGTSGIAASDQTGRLRFTKSEIDALTGGNEEEPSKWLTGLAKPERVIRIGNVTYVSGGVFGEYLPEDKSWLRLPVPSLGATGTTSQVVNVAEPATLKALLAHATQSAGSYRGKITFGELYRVSPWFRAATMAPPTGKAKKTVVSWSLSVDANRLARRLTATYPLGAGGVKLTVETDYSGWGSPVTVKAPPADQVAGPRDLQDGMKADDSPIPLLTP
ncbi:hypothetical protein GCM10017673_41340 [Streptosporangium violaceochromogenes]|nr:hypothetical protein GCM10017673_41340 [Streptosporangium violaceochromogenes]